jgi:hypothetical protein
MFNGMVRGMLEQGPEPWAPANKILSLKKKIIVG